jgi:hypothetical protein
MPFKYRKDCNAMSMDDITRSGFSGTSRKQLTGTLLCTSIVVSSSSNIHGDPDLKNLAV